jgi:hypothetical protein
MRRAVLRGGILLELKCYGPCCHVHALGRLQTPDRMHATSTILCSVSHGPPHTVQLCLTVCRLLCAVWHAAAADLHTVTGVHQHNKDGWLTAVVAAAAVGRLSTAGVVASRAQVATLVPAGGGDG